jgi:hypothetical protein
MQGERFLSYCRAAPRLLGPALRLRGRDRIGANHFFGKYLCGEFAVGPSEEVTFTQLTATENTSRDAVRFTNEREIHVGAPATISK